MPRTGPWQHTPRTESQWEQELARPQCSDGRCNNPQHEHKGEINYTYEKKK